jgi:hypothetical protein
MDRKARIVRVRIDEGKAGLFYASSPDLRGLLVAAPTADDAWKGVPEAIRALFLAKGQKVVVIEAHDGNPTERPWAAIPADVAQKALEGVH